MRREVVLTRALFTGALALAGIDCAKDGGSTFARDLGDDAGVDEASAPPPSNPNAIPDSGASLGEVPDSASPLSGCATATDEVQRSPIEMLLVLDASGSMDEDGKWAAVVPALEAFFDDLAKRADHSFGLGLTVFSDTLDPTTGAGPYPTMDVPIAFVDATQTARLHARLDKALPEGPTPTLSVLVGQYGALEAYLPRAPLLAGGKKVLVLLTDGVPYPNSDEQKPAVVKLAGLELAKTAPQGPITTFAVGVGYTYPYAPSVYDQVFMGNLAVAGGAPNQPCDPNELTVTWNMCHFQVTPSGQPNPGVLEQEFVSAIDRIRSKVTSCELKLVSTDGGLVDPTKVNVTFTDSVTGVQTIFAEDPLDGWTYDDAHAPTEVILHGKACGALQDDPDGAIHVVLGCATIVK